MFVHFIKAEEKILGVNFLDVLDDETDCPDEDTVIQIETLWSLDPLTLNQYNDTTRVGFIGRMNLNQ